MGMVFNATFNNISVILEWSVLLVEESGVLEKTTDLSQVTHKLYHLNIYFYKFVSYNLCVHFRDNTMPLSSIFMYMYKSNAYFGTVLN